MERSIEEILGKLDPEDKELLTKKIAEKTEKLQRMAMIGEWTTEFAHNLGNILFGGISARAELALAELEDKNPEGAKEYLRTILDSSLKIGRQNSRILTFAREGRQQYQLVIMDVYETIDKVVSLLENMVRKDIIIRKHFASGDTYVTGDPVQIQDAILNLAINGINAMPKGGNLIFSAGVVSRGYTRLDVEDTGTGISEKDLPYIFEPYFTRSDGTGLGLASVQRIVKLHKGHIEVDSVPNQGTTFSVYLPPTSADRAYSAKENKGNLQEA